MRIPDWVRFRPQIHRGEILWGGAIFLVALAVRGYFLVEIRGLWNYLILDSLLYFEWAKEIQQGDWLGSQVFHQSPFYAYFLAALLTGIDWVRKIFGTLPFTGDPMFWVRGFQALLGAAGCWLLARVAMKAGTAAEGYAAGFLAAVYGPFIYYDTMVMKTFLATVLSLACFLFLYRSAGVERRALILSGLFLGLTSLVRDNFILMFPFLILGILPWLPRPRRRPTLRAAAWLLAGTAMVVLPVTARNLVVGGELSLLTAGGGEVFYIGNNPEADGRYRPPCIPVQGKPQCVRADPKYEHDDFRQIAGALTGKTLTPMQSSRFWLRQGLAFVWDQPGAYLLLLTKKLGIFLRDTEIADNYDYGMFRRVSFLLALPIPTFGLILGLSLPGIVVSLGRWRRYSLLYAAVGGYTATVLLYLNYYRFRITAVAARLVFSGVGLVWMARQAVRAFRLFLSEGYPSGIQAAALLLAGLAVAAGVIRISRIQGPTTILQTIQRQVQLGELLRLSGHPRRALREFEKARFLVGDAPIEQRLDLLGNTPPEKFRQTLQEERLLTGVNFRLVHSRVYEGLGIVRQDLGDYRQAAADLEESLAIFVDGTGTLRRLSEVYRQAGDLTSSVKLLERALKVQDEFDLRFDLSGLYFERGDPQKAYQILAVAAEIYSNLSAGNLADYHFGLGLILLNGFQRVPEARQHFSESLRLAPDHPQAEEIRNLLKKPIGS